MAKTIPELLQTSKYREDYIALADELRKKQDQFHKQQWLFELKHITLEQYQERQSVIVKQIAMVQLRLDDVTSKMYLEAEKMHPAFSHPQ